MNEISIKKKTKQLFKIQLPSINFFIVRAHTYIGAIKLIFTRARVYLLKNITVLNGALVKKQFPPFDFARCPLKTVFKQPSLPPPLKVNRGIRIYEVAHIEREREKKSRVKRDFNGAKKDY